MSTAATPDMNVKQVVPFFRISDVEHSIRFYMPGLGFTMKHGWLVDEKLRWCWLELGGAALMLQTYVKDSRNAPVGKLGQGVALSFQCEDAVKTVW
jgi:lactoylglutathione lyase